MTWHGALWRGLGLGALVLAAACAETSAPPEKSVPTTPGHTPASTPGALIKRFTEVYAARNSVEYERLFTGDFTFEFSNAVDPSLVQKYSSGWRQADEKISSTNLFQGGVNQDGIFQPAASRVEISLLDMVPVDDNTDGRDPTHYKMLFTPVTVRVTVPVVGDEITYVIGESSAQQSHRFFLVRGDAAVGLSPEQLADSTRWYIWKWQDETPSMSKPSSPQSNESTTWGRLKGLYR